jgi:hypothetical protein
MRLYCVQEVPIESDCRKPVVLLVRRWRRTQADNSQLWQRSADTPGRILCSICSKYACRLRSADESGIGTSRSRRSLYGVRYVSGRDRRVFAAFNTP